MASKTTKTKTAAAKKPASKTTSRANTPAPKRAAAERKAAPLARNTARTVRMAAKPFDNIDMKTALFGAGIGAAVSTLATKLIFFR